MFPVCLQGFYGPSCIVNCQPRNDNHGHYTCSETGTRTCLPGWEGLRCTEPICHDGCSNGKCVAPDKCRCEHGWTGPNCGQCVPYEGCLHGTCNKPFECNCEPRWGGLQCDLDRDYCLHQQPCKNGATCNPHLPNNYTCICPPGFAGRDCELKVSPCYKNPCYHFGTCVVKEGDNQYECICPRAYTGKHCERIRLSQEEDGGNRPSGTIQSSKKKETAQKEKNTVEKVPEPCFYQGQYYPHGTRWDTMDCRQCNCLDAEVNCTRAACMSEDCLQNSRGCPVEQLCQSVQNGLCLKEPCRFPVGQCKPWQLADPGGFPNLCRDRLDAGERTEECSRFYVNLDYDKLPTGTSVETVCFHVTLWLLTKQMDQFTSACRLRMEAPEIWIEIDLAAIKPRWPVTGLKEHLITVLTKNLTVSPVLQSVTTVSHDIQMPSGGAWRSDSRNFGSRISSSYDEETSTNDASSTLIYFGIAACLLVIILILLAVIVSLYRKLRRAANSPSKSPLDSSYGSDTPFATFAEEKTGERAVYNNPSTQRLPGTNHQLLLTDKERIQWNNLRPDGAGVKACQKLTCGLVTPWSTAGGPGRPEKQCNLWKSERVRESLSDSSSSRGSRSNEGQKLTRVFEMDEEKPEDHYRSIATVRPMTFVEEQPEHQSDTFVSKEAAV